LLSEKMAEVTMAQGDDDDPLGSVLMVVVVVDTAGGAWDQAAAGVAPDANKGELKGVHQGNSFVLVFMVGCASSWWLRKRSWKDGCQALQCLGFHGAVAGASSSGQRRGTHRPQGITHQAS